MQTLERFQIFFFLERFFFLNRKNYTGGHKVIEKNSFSALHKKNIFRSYEEGKDNSSIVERNR